MRSAHGELDTHCSTGGPIPPVPMSNLAHLEWITANLENAKLLMQPESDNKREADKLIARAKGMPRSPLRAGSSCVLGIALGSKCAKCGANARNLGA